MDTRIRLASGDAFAEVYDIAAVAYDLEELQDARFIRLDEGEGASVGEHDEEQVACNYLHMCLCNLLGLRAVFLSPLAYGLPWKFAALLHMDADKRSEALDLLALWWQRLQQLDKEALVNTLAKEFRKKPCVPDLGLHILLLHHIVGGGLQSCTQLLKGALGSLGAGLPLL